MKRTIFAVAASMIMLSSHVAFAQEQVTENTEWNTDESPLLSSENATNNAESGVAEEAIDYAISKMGYPYSMERRNSGSAYDCSSLVYYSYKDAGIDLSNGGSTTAAEIARGLATEGRETSAEDLEPGDLIFYSYKNNGRYRNISHVSMYIGNGTQIEASYGKQRVATRPVSLSSAVMIGRPESEENQG